MHRRTDQTLSFWIHLIESHKLKKKNTTFSQCIKLIQHINIARKRDKWFCMDQNNTKTRRKTHLQQFPWISLQHEGFCFYRGDISLQVCGKPFLSVVQLHLWTLPVYCSSSSWQVSARLTGGCTPQVWQQIVPWLYKDSLRESRKACVIWLPICENTSFFM